MKTYYIIILGVGIILMANLLGHFFPPFSLMTSFIYVNVIIITINLKLYKQNFNLTVVYNSILLILNDILIRLYAGGTHDSRGMAWCWIIFYFGFILALIFMVSHFINLKKSNKTLKLDVVLITTILTIIFYELVNSKI